MVGLCEPGGTRRGDGRRRCPSTDASLAAAPVALRINCMTDVARNDRPKDRVVGPRATVTARVVSSDRRCRGRVGRIASGGVMVRPFGRLPEGRRVPVASAPDEL